MNRIEAHPVELAIAAAVITLEAVLVLVVAGLALVLTLAQWNTCSTAEPAAPEAPAPPTAAPEAPLAKPTPHPLALLATELELLPVTALRQMAGIRSKAIRKADLIAMVAACS